ncbi:MAG: hypothetical protein Kow00109_19630 [Acidobacteriota bacterium]
MRSVGFTLLEALIVTSVMVLLAGATWSGWRRCVEAWRVREAAELLGAELARARSLAVQANRSVSVFVHPSATAYGRAPAGTLPAVWRPLPPGVRVVGAPGLPVTFYSRCIAAPAGAYVLAASSCRAKVVVAPFGRIRWEWLRDE